MIMEIPCRRVIAQRSRLLSGPQLNNPETERPRWRLDGRGKCVLRRKLCHGWKVNRPNGPHGFSSTARDKSLQKPWLAFETSAARAVQRRVNTTETRFVAVRTHCARRTVPYYYYDPRSRLHEAVWLAVIAFTFRFTSCRHYSVQTTKTLSRVGR